MRSRLVIGRGAALGREQHLVEVGQLQLVAAELPRALGCRARRARPARRSVGAAQIDRARPASAAGAALTSSLVRPVLTDRGWSSGSHPATAYSSCLCSSSHCSLPPRRAAANQREVAAQLLAVQVEVQVARLGRGDRVGAVGDRPRAPVPHDHVAAAVLARGDDAFEVEVVERVVLDVHRHALRVGIERRSLRHRPAQQHPAGLEPEVVVQARGPVALHDEPMAVLRGQRRAMRGSDVTSKSRFCRYRFNRSGADGL